MRVFIVLTALCSLLLAGCGGSQNDSGTSASGGEVEFQELTDRQVEQTEDGIQTADEIEGFLIENSEASGLGEIRADCYSLPNADGEAICEVELEGRFGLFSVYYDEDGDITEVEQHRGEE